MEMDSFDYNFDLEKILAPRVQDGKAGFLVKLVGVQVPEFFSRERMLEKYPMVSNGSCNPSHPLRTQGNVTRGSINNCTVSFVFLFSGNESVHD